MQAVATLVLIRYDQTFSFLPGPQLPHDLDFQQIPYSQRSQLTIILSGKY